MNRLSVLMFHALDDRRSILSFPPAVFRRALEDLHRRGIQTLSVPDVADRLRRGVPFPTRSIALTFDDGYRSMYDVAFPILRDHGMSATVFVTAGAGPTSQRLPSMEGRAMLSWSEIRQMDAQGITFGAHSCTHPDLTRVPLERADSEMADSKAIIEDALGHAIACFAYPYGRLDRRIRDLATAYFACACSDRLGMVNPSSDPYAIERIDTYYLRGDRLIAMLQSRLYPWYLRARAVPRGIRRAVVSRPG